MRKANLQFGLTLLLPCLLLWHSAGAQRLPEDAASEESRERGEATRISAREAWFYDARVQAASSARSAAQLRGAEATLLAEQSRAPLRTPFAGLSAKPWETLGPAPMTMLTWQMGNVAGRASALAVDPRTDDTLYLGSASGGLWRSTNGGAAWTELLGQSGTQSVGALDRKSVV